MSIKLRSAVRLRLGCGFRRRRRRTVQIRLWVIEPVDLVPMVILEQVRINVQRDADTTMTKLLLNVL